MGKNCCGVNFLTNFLNIFNIIFLLAGFCVSAFAIWVGYNCYEIFPLLPSLACPVFICLLIGAGLLSIISAFVGCCASHTEHRIALIVYVFALVLIALLELGVGVFAYIYSENIQADLQLNLNKTMIESYRISEGQTEATDYVQQRFRCCGVDSYLDWEESDWPHNATFKLPDSCCKTMSLGCGYRDHPSNIHNIGCLQPIADYLEEHLVIMSAVGPGVSVMQLFGIIFGIKLYLQLGKRDHETESFLKASDKNEE